MSDDMELFDTTSRIAVLENEIKNMATDLRDHRKDSKEHYDTMMKKIDNLDQRLQVIERWRWMIIGGSIALGYLAAHFLKI